MTLDCRVTSSEILGDKVHVKLSNGTERLVDHVIVGTGYRVDTNAVPLFQSYDSEMSENRARLSCSGPRTRIVDSRPSFCRQTCSVELWSAS
jgi:hypothetical protein